MACIKIKKELNKAEEVASFLLFILQSDLIPLPKLSIGQILAAKLRPGLNSDIIASSIISRFDEIGIPTGPLGGGTPNVMENLVKVMSEEYVSAIQNDMRVDIATDQGQTVSATGGNAGGPVQAIGATVAPHTAIGVAR